MNIGITTTFSASLIFQPAYVTSSAVFSLTEIYSTSTNKSSFQSSNVFYGHTAAADTVIFANELAREYGFPCWAQKPPQIASVAQIVRTPLFGLPAQAIKAMGNSGGNMTKMFFSDGSNDNHKKDERQISSSNSRPNFYDDDTFHASYIGMRSGTRSANDYIEKLYLARLMPDVTGKRVLDLGCGKGDYVVDFLAGAALIDAVDISEKMLELLKVRIAEKGLNNVNVIQSAMEDFDFKPDSYDLVLSALALHYVAELEPVFKGISRSLVKGGVFIFNVEHPVYTAAKKQGWETGKDGERLHWRIDDYFEMGARRVIWHGIEVVRYHRTVEEYFRLLADNGFQVVRVLEPQPSADVKRLEPDLEKHYRRPAYLMFLAYKK